MKKPMKPKKQVKKSDNGMEIFIDRVHFSKVGNLVFGHEAVL